MTFADRQEAGRRLAAKLRSLRMESPIVVGLPRGGVVVADEVARELGAPLDIVVVRKVGHPMQPEYGIGAVTEDDFYWIDPRAVQDAEFDAETLEKLLIREAREVRRRIHAYRGVRPPLPLEGRTAILVDDGLATGVSARAAADLMRGRGASRVILAVPVAAPSSAEALVEENVVDDLVCLTMPEEFHSVGQWYEDFTQITNEEVVQILEKYQEKPKKRAASSTSEVDIPAAASITLKGLLSLPKASGGLNGTVIFAHGSGSSRMSPRNLEVARSLNRAGIATLLFDLLTEEEGQDRGNVFNIPLLAERLLAATRFIRVRRELLGAPLGYFGASTGVAAALWAAADAGPGNAPVAIVGRGGRPDLAMSRLDEVRTPVLLIVGQNDEPVIGLNQQALVALPHSDLIIVPGATHLFEEPGALEAVSRHAIEWFSRHFAEERHRHAAAA